LEAAGVSTIDVFCFEYIAIFLPPPAVLNQAALEGQAHLLAAGPYASIAAESKALGLGGRRG
jgi:hypothetical protein